MTQTNDERILKLKKQIEYKKEQIGKPVRFNPITNCSLELEGTRININTLPKQGLLLLLVRLNSYLLSAIHLELQTEVELSGYKLEEWIADIQSKLDLMSQREEAMKLATMEEKLLKLLSEGKKTELEIDEIESFLK